VSAIIVLLHVIVCLVLIFAVLLQSGKAADLAGAFGGGGSQTAFGARGHASLLSKVTTGAAVLFMLTSLGLWILSGQESSSVVGGEEAPAATTETAQPPDKSGEAAATAAQPETKAGDEKPPAKETPVKK
jgi:preprotein translocase subunit SecG